MEYIDKTFKRNVNYERLCEEKLVFFKKGHVGSCFSYKVPLHKNLLVKRTTVSKKICNEAIMLKKINVLMESKKIPDLFGKVYLIYKCQRSDFSKYGFDRDATITDESGKEISIKKISRHELNKYLNNYIFIMDKYGSFIWEILDSKDIKKVKSIVMLLLIAIWHMNHNGDMYHDDIVVGKPGELVINNVLLEKTSKKYMSLFLSDKKKFNIKLYGFSIRIIDFGKACFKNIYTQEKIRLDMNTSINQFYGRNPIFKNFKFKSEILFTIKCLFTYWNFDDDNQKIDNMLFDYYSKIARNIDSFSKFDEEVIMDFNKNFIKLIRIFSIEWPNPPYYMK